MRNLDTNLVNSVHKRIIGRLFKTWRLNTWLRQQNKRMRKINETIPLAKRQRKDWKTHLCLQWLAARSVQSALTVLNLKKPSTHISNKSLNTNQRTIKADPHQLSYQLSTLVKANSKKLSIILEAELNPSRTLQTNKTTTLTFLNNPYKRLNPSLSKNED